ncbi:hypothetical protein [Streptomyces sp. NPDC005573]|uniref:hypothetical protein n=1 Tax=Streptomyces sp. NPDC005573 TaxID=3156890 RepID=UPI0033B2DC8A
MANGRRGAPATASGPAGPVDPGPSADAVQRVREAAEILRRQLKRPGGPPGTGDLAHFDHSATAGSLCWGKDEQAGLDSVHGTAE